MASYFENRDKIFADLCKDESYPCQRCKYKIDPQKRMECGDKNCEKWEMWFRRIWRRIHEKYKTGEEK